MIHNEIKMYNTSSLFYSSPPAVCAPDCMNGGTCTSPNMCQCGDGWSGDHCQTCEICIDALVCHSHSKGQTPILVSSLPMQLHAILRVRMWKFVLDQTCVNVRHCNFVLFNTIFQQFLVLFL